MIDRQEVQSLTKDSYSSEELDPNKTNAIESSLWEIEVNSFNDFFVVVQYNLLVSYSSSSPRCSDMCSCPNVSSKNK